MDRVAVYGRASMHRKHSEAKRATEILIYTVLEQNLGAIAASIPPIKALVRKRWPNFLQAKNYGGSMMGREEEQLRTTSGMMSKGSSVGTAADANLENGLQVPMAQQGQGRRKSHWM
ncbi:hypothetical protein TWF694_007711 [Orbilia ellipsospora]|uniref:Uncharacterized protein n=1 Tax=Orbilia ellipsospora TaxID=2528407 RepID=A0AAV9XQ85_9PEZI